MWVLNFYKERSSAAQYKAGTVLATNPCKFGGVVVIIIIIITGIAELLKNKARDHALYAVKFGNAVKITCSASASAAVIARFLLLRQPSLRLGVPA